MKKIKVLTLLFISMFVLQGCTTSESNNPCDGNPVKIAVVTDSGGINDKSFNQGTWEGVQEYCTENAVGATVYESSSETDYVPNLTNASETDGIEVVIAVGESLNVATGEVAQEHPETKYILIDSEPKDVNGEVLKLDNVDSYLFNEQEAGYLVGYIAGKLTSTNKVGFIGGMEITPVQKFGWGYVQGVYDANPEAEVYYQYSGTFSDPAKGTQIADGYYTQGVDIIFSAAGGVNDGVLNSAKQRKQNGEDVWVIGVDRDMYEDGIYDGENSVILTSALKNVGDAAKIGLDNAFSDSYKASTTVLGFNDGGVGLPENNPNITDTQIITEAENSLKSKEVADDLEGTEANIGDLKINGEL